MIIILPVALIISLSKVLGKASVIRGETKHQPVALSSKRENVLLVLSRKKTQAGEIRICMLH